MRCSVLLLPLLNVSLTSAAQDRPSLRRTQSVADEPDWVSLFTTVSKQCGKIDRCEDVPYFRDSRDHSCDYYADTSRCSDRQNSNGESSNSACCSCGGGIMNFSDCTDYSRFRDSLNRDCSWYAENTSRCTSRFQNSRGQSANDACCVCSGGEGPISDYKPICKDNSGYKDRDGYTCSFYEENVGECDDIYANAKGISPCEACCICGGGSTSAPSGGQFAGIFEIQSKTTGRYLHFSNVRGVTMSFDKVYVKIIGFGNNYALQQYNAYGDLDDTYLTIDKPTGSAYVTVTNFLTSMEEFVIETSSSWDASGAITIQHAESGRYLRALSNGQVSVSRTVSLSEHFLLEEFGMADEIGEDGINKLQESA